MKMLSIPQLDDIDVDVWMSERHSRDLEITDNPVEFGAPITDHAFVKPRTLSISVGVTNTPLGGVPALSALRVDEVRDKLYDLQNSRKFITVDTLTGGTYSNCLLESISWDTDKESVYSVIFQLSLREVHIVSTNSADAHHPADTDTEKRVSPTKKRGVVPSADLTEENRTKRLQTRDVSRRGVNAGKVKAIENTRSKL